MAGPIKCTDWAFPSGVDWAWLVAFFPVTSCYYVSFSPFSFILAIFVFSLKNGLKTDHFYCSTGKESIIGE